MRETRTNKRLSSTEAVLELFKKEVQRNEILDFDDFAAFNEDRLAIGLKSDEVEMLLQRLTRSINKDTRTNILQYRRALLFAFAGLSRCVLSNGLAIGDLELER